MQGRYVPVPDEPTKLLDSRGNYRTIREGGAEIGRTHSHTHAHPYQFDPELIFNKWRIPTAEEEEEEGAADADADAADAAAPETETGRSDSRALREGSTTASLARRFAHTKAPRPNPMAGRPSSGSAPPSCAAAAGGGGGGGGGTVDIPWRRQVVEPEESSIVELDTSGIAGEVGGAPDCNTRPGGSLASPSSWQRRARSPRKALGDWTAMAAAARGGGGGGGGGGRGGVAPAGATASAMGWRDGGDVAGIGARIGVRGPSWQGLGGSTLAGRRWR
jgi:hypothetical protein